MQNITPTMDRAALLKSRLMQPVELTGRSIDPDAQWRLSIERAAVICATLAPSVKAIHELTDEWWNFHIDPIFALDKGACVLVFIQLNLVVGELVRYLDVRPELDPLVEKLRKFEVLGCFCLTELDHGLDARNLETTAEMTPSGGFILHTPHPGASKFMPPTAPSGIPCTGIVFAKLLVDGEERGVRGFLVDISDGYRTMPGITVRVLHGRPGCKQVEHSITSFNQVALPRSALLGPLEAPEDERKAFQSTIWRVAVGAISFAGPVINSLRVSAFIAAKYSQRRTVAGGPTQLRANARRSRVPIITFRTQAQPVMLALSRALVFEAYYHWAARYLSDTSNSYEERHGVATVLKLLVQRSAEDSVSKLAERCGAQGQLHHNQMASLSNEMKGVAIAEGDALVLSIRLASELLIGRYTLPAPKQPDSPLTQHERGKFAEALKVTDEIQHHRSDAFNRLVLPRSEDLILSIGYRMAYEAAVEAGVDPLITELYCASAVRSNADWFVEKKGMTREYMFREEVGALEAALPFLDRWTSQLGVEDYVWAPIVSTDAWENFFGNLGVCQSLPKEGNGQPFFDDLKNTIRALL